MHKKNIKTKETSRTEKHGRMTEKSYNNGKKTPELEGKSRVYRTQGQWRLQQREQQEKESESELMITPLQHHTIVI